MEILKTYILPALAWLLVTGIPTVIGFIRKHKAYRAAQEEIANAKTEQERAEAEARAEAAKNAIYAETKRLVAEAEVMYAPTDALHKSNGQGTAGALKKSYVLNALRAFCYENGISFAVAELDKAIEEEVAYTKTVNGKSA